MSTFKIGDEVEWTSQAGGQTRTKRGKVVEVVPPDSLPAIYRVECITARDHESYIIRAVALGRADPKRRSTYWPRVSQLMPSPSQDRSDARSTHPQHKE